LQCGATDATAARLSNCGGKRMFNTIQQESKSDLQLAKLLAEARDFAQVYVLARQRQKGCDGMGELATLMEEFRDVADKVLQYCKEKKYISEVISYDIDSIAEEIVKEQDPL
jgi:hypothetical protein